MGIISSIKTLGQCQDHLGLLNNLKLFQRYSELASLIDSLVIYYQVMVLSGFSTEIEEHSVCGYLFICPLSCICGENFETTDLNEPLRCLTCLGVCALSTETIYLQIIRQPFFLDYKINICSNA